MKKAYFIITGIVFLLLCFIVGFSAWNITQEHTVEIIPEAYQVISLDDATGDANIDAFMYNRNGFLDDYNDANYTTSFEIYYTLSAPSEATDVTFTLHDESNFLSSATITAKYYLKNGSNYDLESSASGKAITISVSSAIDFCIEYTITTTESNYLTIYNSLNAGRDAYVEAVASGSANWSINKKVNLLMKRYVDLAWDYVSAFTYDGQNKTVSLTSVENSTLQDITVVYGNNVKKDAGEYTATAQVTFDADKLILTYGGSNLSSGTTCQLIWTINKKDLSITVDNKTITYYDVEPEYTVTPSGLVNGETLEDNGLAPNCNSSYTQGSNVGTYTITIENKTCTNYNVTYTNGTLTVEQREISINWSNLTFEYDGNTHTPTATASGVMGSDTVSITVVAGAINVGTHIAEATALSNSNYKLPSNKTQNYTITPANLTIRVANKEITYYDDVPSYTYTPEGLKQPFDVIDSVSLTCSYTKSSNVGTYDINASNLVLSTGSLSNYNVTYVKGTLTVNPATLTATVEDCEAEHTGSALTPNPTKSATSLNNQAISWQYKVSGGSYSSTMPTFTDMGSHTVYYKVSTPNHNDLEGSFTFSIYYLISFAAGAHGTGTAALEQIYAHTYDATNAIDSFTPNTGYHFSGWSATGGATVSGNNISNINSSITLTATWDPNLYTITWKNDDGSTLETDTNVAYGATPSYDGATPTKASTAQYNYTFAGWSPAISTVTGDATYTATFTPVTRTYTVTWKNDDGTVLETDSNVPYGTTPTYNSATPTKAATAQYTYTFSVWSPAVGAIAGDTIYTATFNQTPVTYSITYNLNGGSISGSYATTYTCETPTITLPTPTNGSLTFNGWYESSDFSGSQVTQIVQGSTGNKVFYAKWTDDSYTIAYVLNDVTGTVTNAAGNLTTYNASTSFTLVNLTRSYSQFVGWYTDSACTNKITVFNGSDYISSGDVTLYAKWSAFIYTIKYYDGSTQLSLSPSTYTCEDSITLPTYTKTNHTFNGWYDNSSFTGSAITQIPLGSGGNITLYAKTTDLGYDVKFYDTDKTTLITTIHAATNGSITAPSYTYDTTNYVLKWCDKTTNLEVDLTNIDKAYNLYAKLVDKRYHVLLYYTDKDNYLNNYYDMEGNIYSDLGMKSIGDTITLTRQMRIYEGYTRDVNGTSTTDYKDIFYMSPVDTFNWSWMDSLIDSTTSTYGNANVLCKTDTIDDVKYLYIVVLCIQPVAIMTSSSQTMAYSTNTNMATGTYTFYKTMDDAFTGFNNQASKVLRIYGRMSGLTTSNCLTNNATVSAHNITININSTDVTFKVPALTYSINDYTVTRSSTTISSSSKLLLPYLRSCTDTTGYLTKQTASTGSYIQSILKLDTSATLTNNGVITVGGYAYSSGGTIQGHGVIVNNGTIINNNEINAYGYIKGSGLIDSTASSTITDVFKIYDWPGGADALGMYDKNIFPFNCYSVHNVSCKTKVVYNATYKAWTQLYMASSWATAADIVILGSGGLFSLTSGYIYKWAECTTTQMYLTNESRTVPQQFSDSNQNITQRDVLEIHGNFQDNAITIKVSLSIISRTISTNTNLALPIGFMNIIVAEGSGTLSVNSYKFLPGSRIEVQQGASLTIGSSVKLLVYEDYSDKDVQYTNSSGAVGTYSNGYWNKHSAIYSSDHVLPAYYAQFIVDGTLNGNGSIGGKITASSDTGYLNLTKTNAALPKLSTLKYGSTGSSATVITDTLNLQLMLYNASTGIINDYAAISSTGVYVGVEGLDSGSNQVYGYAKADNVNAYTISYVTNYSGTVSSSTINTINTNYTIKDTDLPNITRSGYTFLGWYIDNNTFNTPAVGYVISGNITVYAKWSINTYYIQYHYSYEEGCQSSGNIVNNNPTSFTINSDITFAAATDGTLSFNGWFVDFDMTTSAPRLFSSSFNSYMLIIDDNNTLHLFAQFSNIQKFNYTYFDESNNPGTSGQVRDGESITLATPSQTQFDKSPNGNYSKTHYEFDKWDIRDTNGTHLIYKNAGESYTLTQSIYIRPIYNTTNYYKITFSKNSTPGGNAGTITVYYKNPSDSSYSSFSQAFGSSSLSRTNIEIIEGGSIYYTKGNNVNSVTYAGSSWSDGSGNAKTVNANATVVLQSTTSSSCLLPNTLITLQNGEYQEIQYLKPSDIVMVFNHETGMLDFAPVTFNEYEEAQWFNVIHLLFDNGANIGVISEHGFFDLDTMKYEYIDDSNYRNYIGHRFYTQEGTPTVLVDGYITEEYTMCYSLPSYYHLNLFTEDILSMPGGIAGLFNYFEYADNLQYDQEKMIEDINTYGLFTVEEFEPYGVTEEMFYAYAGQYLKVSLGKGILTEEYLMYLIERYGAYTE